MRAILLGAAGALTLTLGLSACQQPAEPEAPATDPSAMNEATDAAGPSAPSTTNSGGSAPASATGGAGANGAASSDLTSAPPPGEGPLSGPSPETRDSAQEKAEQSNLHPRTP